MILPADTDINISRSFATIFLEASSLSYAVRTLNYEQRPYGYPVIIQIGLKQTQQMAMTSILSI